MAYAYSSGDGMDKVDGSLKVTGRTHLASEVDIGTDIGSGGAFFTIASGASGISNSTIAGRTAKITNDTAGRLRFYIENTAATSGQRVFLLENNSGGLQFASMIDSASGFVIPYIIQLRYDGKVGIGQSSPDVNLTVSGAISMNAQAAPTLTGTVSSGAIFVSGGALWYKGYGGTQTQLAGS